MVIYIKAHETENPTLGNSPDYKNEPIYFRAWYKSRISYCQWETLQNGIGASL